MVDQSLAQNSSQGQGINWDALAFAASVAQQERERRAAYEAGRAAADQHQRDAENDREIDDLRARRARGATAGPSGAHHAGPWHPAHDTRQVTPLAHILDAPAPPAEPLTLAPDHYRTSVELTAELMRRGLPRAALALDAWKAATRAAGGSGEYLSSEGLTALLVRAGLSRRTAQRSKSEGAGLAWDATPDPRDRRRVIYHLRGYVAIQRALGLADLGKWAILPAVAYTGLAAYVNHASAAWIAAHPTSDRHSQAEALGCSINAVRQRQHAAGLLQEPRIDDYGKPETLAEQDELNARLARRDRPEERVHHWRGPGGSWRRQVSNFYHTSPARILGRKRSRRIAAHANLTSRFPGAAGEADFEQLPRRFDRSEGVHEWQAKHPTRGALVYAGHLLPTGALMYGYHYSANAAYSLEAV